MDLAGGYIGLGILIIVVWYLAIFGEVKKEDDLTTHTIKKPRSIKSKKQVN